MMMFLSQSTTVHSVIYAKNFYQEKTWQICIYFDLVVKRMFLWPRCLSSHQHHRWLSEIHSQKIPIYKSHTGAFESIQSHSFMVVFCVRSSFVQQSRNAISQTDIKIDPRNTKQHNSLHMAHTPATNWFPILWWLWRKREEKCIYNKFPLAKSECMAETFLPSSFPFCFVPSILRLHNVNHSTRTRTVSLFTPPRRLREIINFIKIDRPAIK